MNESIKAVVSKMEELIKTVNEMTKEDLKNSIYIRSLYKQHDQHKQRLDDHADRLKNIELSIASKRKVKEHDKASQ